MECGSMTTRGVLFLSPALIKGDTESLASTSTTICYVETTLSDERMRCWSVLFNRLFASNSWHERRTGYDLPRLILFVIMNSAHFVDVFVEWDEDERRDENGVQMR